MTLTLEDLTLEQRQELTDLLKQRASHQHFAVRNFGATVFSNLMGQSLAYSTIPHWSSLVAPIALGLRGTYRTYSSCRREVRAVDAQLREFCARLG
ncbi:MAG TPA: hypothetical protein VJH37_02225, partial [Candidatus Nanoarchaeia archaeon]|nr:hypothetical protein [Candidatus Nanoarchaeia archaeon]